MITVNKVFNKSITIKHKSLSNKLSIKPKKIQPKISLNVISYYAIASDDSVSTKSNVIYHFTANDLIDNRLRRVHLLNSDVVDVSVIDDAGVEIELTPRIIDKNTIELDFNRISVNNTWKVMIEV